MLLNLEIVLISAGLIGGLALFSPVRGWIGSMKRLPMVAVLLIGLFTSVLLTAQNQATFSVNAIDESRFIRIGLLSSLCALSWLIFAVHGFPFARCGSALMMTFVFSLCAMSSFLYSSNPLLSLWKGFEVFAAASVFLAIASCLDELDDIDDALQVVWLILLFLLLTALVGGILQPRLAFVRQILGHGSQAYEYWGLFPRINPNSLTQFGAMVGMSGLIAFLYARGLVTALTSACVLFLGLITIYLGHSRTSLLGFVLAALTVFWFGKKRLVGLVIGAGTAIVGLVAYASLQAYVFRGQSKAVFMSLSGRLSFWPQVWKAFTESPVVGHGYYAGHRALTINELTLVSSVDNTYLEVLVDLGVIGCLILLCALLCACATVYACRPVVLDRDTADRWRPTWLLMLGALLLLGIRSLTGPTFQVLHPNLLIFLAIAVCSASARRLFVQDVIMEDGLLDAGEESE